MCSELPNQTHTAAVAAATVSLITQEKCCTGQASVLLLDCQNSNAGGGLSKSSSRPLGRQRNSINYSLLAGNRKPDAKVAGTAHKGSKKGGHKQSPAPQSDVRKDQAAIAVAAAIASGSAPFMLLCHPFAPLHHPSATLFDPSGGTVRKCSSSACIHI